MTVTEGYVLKKRTGVRRTGFVKRYFTLDHATGRLRYSKEKGQDEQRGSVDLKTAAVTVDNRKKLIIVDGGRSLWQMRPLTDHDFLSWSEALRKSKMQHPADFVAGMDLGVSFVGRKKSILDGRFPSAPAPHSAGSSAAMLEEISSELEEAKKKQDKVMTAMESIRGPGTAELIQAVTELLDATTKCVGTMRAEERVWRVRFMEEEEKRRWLEIAVRTLEASMQGAQERVPKTTGVPGVSVTPPAGDGAFLASQPHRTSGSRGSAGDSQMPDNNFFYSQDSDEDDDEVHEVDDSAYETAEDSLSEDEGCSAPVRGSSAPSSSDSRSSAVSRSSSFLGLKFKSAAGLPKELRTRLPHGKIEDGASLWSVLRKNIGKDLSKVALPVTFNEPLGALQKLCEEVEYSHLILSAAKCASSTERLMYVAAFAVTGYSSTATRAQKKPFNPVLGETFEYVDPQNQFKFVAEQVSHHPPISACYCEGEGFQYTQHVTIKNKFWGKTMEVIPQGRIELRLPGTGDHFVWNKVSTTVHNIMVGEMWLDHHGVCEIVNKTTGEKCEVSFTQAGWFNQSRGEVTGSVKDSSGKETFTLSGKWNLSLSATNVSTGATSVVWEVASRPADSEEQYGFTSFAIGLNGITDEIGAIIPPTDTRKRPDQRALEEGRVDEAAEHKRKIEERQRAEAKKRESAGKPWSPLWFNSSSSGGKDAGWEFTDEYWKVRNSGDKKKWKACAPMW